MEHFTQVGQEHHHRRKEVCYEIGKEQSYGDRNEDRMVQIKEETQKTGYHNYQKGEIGLKRSNRVKRLN